MFAVTGKIWSVDKIEFNDKNFLRMVVKKKRNDKEIMLCFLIFKEDVMKQYKEGYFGMGDYVETKFYIKANQQKDRYYNNLFVEKISVLRKKKSKSLNMFDSNELPNFE
jgi:hypothetical protein